MAGSEASAEPCGTWSLEGSARNHSGKRWLQTSAEPVNLRFRTLKSRPRKRLSCKCGTLDAQPLLAHARHLQLPRFDPTCSHTARAPACISSVGRFRRFRTRRNPLAANVITCGTLMNQEVPQGSAGSAGRLSRAPTLARGANPSAGRPIPRPGQPPHTVPSRPPRPSWFLPGDPGPRGQREPPQFRAQFV